MLKLSCFHLCQATGGNGQYRRGVVQWRAAFQHHGEGQCLFCFFWKHLDTLCFIVTFVCIAQYISSKHYLFNKNTLLSPVSDPTNQNDSSLYPWRHWRSDPFANISCNMLSSISLKYTAYFIFNFQLSVSAVHLHVFFFFLWYLFA